MTSDKNLPFWDPGPASSLLGQHDRGTHHPLAPRNRTIKNDEWLMVAKAIAAFAQHRLTRQTSLASIIGICLEEVPAVKKYLNGAIGIERNLRIFQVKRCLAEWISYVITKPEEE